MSTSGNTSFFGETVFRVKPSDNSSAAPFFATNWVNTFSRGLLGEDSDAAFRISRGSDTDVASIRGCPKAATRKVDFGLPAI